MKWASRFACWRGSGSIGSVTTASDFRWLTLPELVDLLGIGVSKVRRLIEDHTLLASQVDGVWKVPEVFIRDAEPLSELRGTILVLHDSGFSDDEAMRWLLTVEESIGIAPIDALRAGRKAEVRRVAQALGF
nr:Rv2175c family DNA-binding protein [Frigoribacterium sp. CG_9.8]